MTKSKISLLGSLFVAGALVAAGCGSSGGGGGTGGAAGSGTGGRTGSGGSGTGSGGSGTGAGGADAGVARAINYTFDTAIQGWVLNNFPQAGNLDGPDALDGGMLDGGVVPTLTFDSAAGNPSPGSLKVTATFTDYNQYIDPIVNFSSMDLTGKTLHAKVMLMSGTWPGYAVIHASSTNTYIYDAKGYGGLTAGTWTDLTFDLSTATSTGFTAAQIVQIGIQVGTGAPPDAGVKLPAPIPVVLNIDTVID
jgi:hypothetical protein